MSQRSWNFRKNSGRQLVIIQQRSIKESQQLSSLKRALEQELVQELVVDRASNSSRYLRVCWLSKPKLHTRISIS
ncbi:hypothetical protein G9C98_006860 [Cotesia typhae]|uniref:Uncharacterized protein n=1 Tax=Cotesia typhae TaxID=2053667 RepID=A0A8J5R234_9HYME|nr:hypothetical protein G9C98_006860 [Cotesia typhae]